jgi:hypothetical protein
MWGRSFYVRGETELPTEADFASEIPCTIRTVSLGSGVTYETNAGGAPGVIQCSSQVPAQASNWLSFR